MISEIIKKLRNSNKYTQKQLAEKLNCNRQKIADWERGKSIPSTDDLVLLSRVFHVSTDFLLGLTPYISVDNREKFVCEYTGLSENVVRILHRKSFASAKRFNERNDLVHAINILVNYDSRIFFQLFRAFQDYKNVVEKKKRFQTAAKSNIPYVPLSKREEEIIIYNHETIENDIVLTKCKIQQLIQSILDTYTIKEDDDEDYKILYQYLYYYNESDREKYGTNMTNGTKTAEQLRSNLNALQSIEFPRNPYYVETVSSAELDDLQDELDAIQEELDEFNEEMHEEVEEPEDEFDYEKFMELHAQPDYGIEIEDTNEHTETKE